MRRNLFIWIMILLIVPLLTQAQGLPPANPGGNTGEIRIAGISPLVPLTNMVVTSYQQDGFDGNVSVGVEDPNSAFARFCAGELDIVLSAQQPSPVEMDNCEAAGLSILSFRVATDAVTVAASQDNTFLDSLTTAELQQVFGNALSWSSVRPDWPGDPIGRFGPATTSGDFALFAALVFGGDTRALTTALGAQYSEDVNLALQSVQASPTAIGFFDADFADRNAAMLKLIPIGGVLPSTQNITELVYPLARPLFLFTATSVIQTQPHIADFVNYYMTVAPLEIQATDLYGVSQSARDAAAANWFEAIGSAPPPTEETETPPPATEETETPPPVAATEEPAPEPTAAAASFDAGVLPILINARTDLELLATETLGVQRPAGWSGSLDVNDPQLALLIRLDLEVLAGTIFSAESRPENWFGAVPSTPLAMARDIRHDLELLADAVFGSNVARPSSWLGDNPLYRCSRSTQSLVNILENSGFVSGVDEASVNYCAEVEVEASRYAENVLAQPNSPAVSGAPAVIRAGAVAIDTEFAVGFANRGASMRVGTIPFGESITPVARSYTQFSNMTLVEGDDFRVFIDWQDTTMAASDFEALPDEAEAALETFCDADWCTN